ncbi:NfeD family protein [Marivivens marinus]|uniref:NfeD family protein n=1 Tax=Marivivens marinus TaxID=3110173 RepID=UPI003B84988B
MSGDWWTVWWVWMAAAFGLAILEVIVPGYIFLGFAAGALIVGAIVGVGITMGLAGSLVVFAILSLAAFIALRKVFGLRSGQVKIWDKDIND